MKKVKLMRGDNLESLKKLPDNSIDSVVTDPPYGLSFMNKKWDYDVPSVELWKEVYRVLKPGGHVLSFGGTRTYHRMVVNMEDAGFEIRDQIMWLYGSGFPKSLNIGKAVDKLEGNEREDLGKNPAARPCSDKGNYETNSKWKTPPRPNITRGTSPFEGWGTGLKPANEPICLARKPISENTIAENVIKWGTGGINVDGCRIGFVNEIDKESAKPGSLNATGKNSMFGLRSGNEQNTEGRFPANLILECICDEVIKGENKGKTPGNYERTYNDNNPSYVVNNIKSGEHYNDKGDIHTNPMCPCRLLDEQSGILKSGFGEVGSGDSINDGSKVGMKGKIVSCYSDQGGASRFFYQAKVSKQERNMGLDGFEEKKMLDRENKNKSTIGSDSPKKNFHPTVKPINLMTYLCRLITPKGGIVLDPYMGSGSTGISALLEDFRFCGMEMDEGYFKIAESRIENYEKYRNFLKK